MRDQASNHLPPLTNCVYRTRLNGVDSNRIWPQFSSENLSELLDGSLARCVCVHAKQQSRHELMHEMD